eukprot:15464087-Alexandrium_andersonii.AAC.1
MWSCVPNDAQGRAKQRGVSATIAKRSLATTKLQARCGMAAVVVVSHGSDYGGGVGYMVTEMFWHIGGSTEEAVLSKSSSGSLGRTSARHSTALQASSATTYMQKLVHIALQLAIGHNPVASKR